MEWIYLWPAKLVAESPSLLAVAIVLAAVAGAVARSRSMRAGVPSESRRSFAREPLVFTALVWGIYLLYELQMAATFVARHAAAGGSTLRWDMLILTPVLTGISVLAVVTTAQLLRGSPASKSAESADTKADP